ncbi:MAG: heavy-metal-associated domain-containing protein [Geothrix sp.]|jgi:copper chaperone CopZ|uniref:Heavy-metal-associated domain-containing protein n=1 Tax=Candidatus Geothrix odensensis TaxID=2954440 RepID=A0A936F156_9BACT|nr:heavy-metal-associated domain-containing protein [Candidatus Geothrix odensensis]MBK8791169.1 heavy-metal-associated domain-containing protein [Holophagaceae bacterium]MBP7617972.1 heavy-metal-associated domain-containing protein [Geothrix sp.]MCC6512862.1 heavy-metal-associated domain-containing protein [Geothrix sp.]
MDTQVFKVKGMTCGGCAKHVEKALRSVAGIVQVDMDVPNGTAKVLGDAPFELLAERVANAGYELVRPA